MKPSNFSQKNQLQAWSICWIGRALYAKTSHRYPHNLGMRDVLSPSSIGAHVLGAKADVCLYGCFWKKTIGRSSRQILPQENRRALCEGGRKYRSKTASSGDHCRGARSRALPFKMLAFCQGSPRCCRSSEIPAADNP